MITRQTLSLCLLIPFLALTAYALYTVGYIGIFDYHRHSPAGWQVFADLVIALIIVMMFLIPDAKKAGRNPWPWVIATLFLGSIAPLCYLVLGKKTEKSA
ncbi:MAG: hypothetical protein Alis3KO_32500 [Aliiglaciecola sp.]